MLNETRPDLIFIINFSAQQKSSPANVLRLLSVTESLTETLLREIQIFSDAEKFQRDLFANIMLPTCDPQGFDFYFQFPVTYLWCSLTTAKTSSERWRESSENLKSSFSWAFSRSTWDSSPASVFLTPCNTQTRKQIKWIQATTAANQRWWWCDFYRVAYFASLCVNTMLEISY